MSYLVHSAVSLAVLGAIAWLGDRLLRRVGPLAQHRMWVGALLAGAALPLLPVETLIRWFSHADAHAAGGTATVTYSMIAARVEHWSGFAIAVGDAGRGVSAGGAVLCVAAAMAVAAHPRDGAAGCGADARPCSGMRWWKARRSGSV